MIRVTNADYLARPLRLTPTEATRADRGAAGAARRAPTTPPATSSTARSPSSRRRPTRAPSAARRRSPTSTPTWRTPRRRGSAPVLEDAVTRRHRQLRLTLLRARPRRGVRPRRRPSRIGHQPQRGLPRRLVPHRAGAPAVPPRPDPTRPRCWTPACRPRPRSRATCPPGCSRPPRTPRPVTLRLARRGALGAPSTTPSTAIRRLDGDELEIDLLVADPRWLQRLLLRLAPHARVVAPAGAGGGVHRRRTARRSACIT